MQTKQPKAPTHHLSAFSGLLYCKTLSSALITPGPHLTSMGSPYTGPHWNDSNETILGLFILPHWFFFKCWENTSYQKQLCMCRKCLNIFYFIILKCLFHNNTAFSFCSAIANSNWHSSWNLWHYPLPVPFFFTILFASFCNSIGSSVYAFILYI